MKTINFIKTYITTIYLFFSLFVIDNMNFIKDILVLGLQPLRPDMAARWLQVPTKCNLLQGFNKISALVELTVSCHDAFASLLELINFLGSLLKAMLRFLSFSSSRLQLSLIRSCFGKYRGKNNQGKKGAEKSGLRMHNNFSTSTSSVDWPESPWHIWFWVG